MPDEGTPETLRQQLINAEISRYAGQRWDKTQVWQYTFRSNETAAGVALAVFRDWLRDRADDVAANFPDSTDVFVAEALRELADAIDKELNTDG